MADPFRTTSRYLAAYLITQGHPVGPTSKDETGLVTFEFSTEFSLMENLQVFHHPATQVSLQEFIQAIEYVWALIKEAKEAKL